VYLSGNIFAIFLKIFGHFLLIRYNEFVIVIWFGGDCDKCGDCMQIWT